MTLNKSITHPNIRHINHKGKRYVFSKFCSRCGSKLSEEEVKSPRRTDWDKQPICESCYSEIYECECPLCQNLVRIEEIDDGGKIGNVVIVQDSNNKTYIKTGVYEIIDVFSVDYDSWYNNGVRLLTEIVPELNSYDDWCYVCKDCSKNLIKTYNS